MMLNCVKKIKGATDENGDFNGRCDQDLSYTFKSPFSMNFYATNNTISISRCAVYPCKKWFNKNAFQ